MFKKIIFQITQVIEEKKNPNSTKKVIVNVNVCGIILTNLLCRLNLLFTLTNESKTIFETPSQTIQKLKKIPKYKIIAKK